MTALGFKRGGETLDIPGLPSGAQNTNWVTYKEAFDINHDMNQYVTLTIILTGIWHNHDVNRYMT